MKSKYIKKSLISFLVLVLALPLTALAQDTDNPITNEDSLKAAILAAQPGETIYVTDMVITKEHEFKNDVNVILASATGETVTLNALKPSVGNYTFNFNGASVNLTFKDVVMQGDDAHVLIRFQNTVDITRTITGGVFKNGFRGGNGGALYAENGGMKVVNCRFENNTAQRGPAIYIGNANATGNGDAVIENCTFINNTSTGFEGGAVSIRGDTNPAYGNVKVSNCYFENNSVIGNYVISNGGALAATGNIEITSSKFVNNSAKCGGAVSSWGNDITISDSEFTGNRSTLDAAIASANEQYGYPVGGGAICSHTANITISNTNISNNSTTQNGGAIWIADLSKLTLDNVTFSNNSASAGHFWRAHSPADEKQTADAAIHNEKVATTSYTAPYTNAYSNYDVNYTAATLFIPYTVAYNGNGNDKGAVPADSNSPYIEGETATVQAPPDTFLKSGYRFTGWNTISDGSGTPYKNPQIFTINSNVVLYAQWEKLPVATPAPRPPAPTPSPLPTPEPTPEFEIIPDVPATITPEPPMILPEPEIPEPLPEVVEIAPDFPLEYPPEHELIPEDEETIEVIDTHGTILGRWTKDNNENWTYQENYPIPSPSLQLTPNDNGTFETVDTDDMPIGLWSKDEDGDWLYEEYPKSISVWLVLALLVLVGLLFGIWYFIVFRRHITRQEFVRLVADTINLEADIDNTAPYKDVPDDAGYYNAVMCAKAAEMLSGFPGSEFKPNIAITREEMASILAGTVRYKNAAVTAGNIDLSAVFNDFDDMDASFLTNIQLVVQTEIMGGKLDNRFDPKGLSTRRQAKETIKSLLETIPK